MTDVWTAGRIDARAQASLGIISQIFMLLMLLTSLIGSGCMATISQSLGAGLRRRAERYAGLIVLLSALSGTGIAAAALPCGPAIYSLMQVPVEIRPVLASFFTAYCLHLPFFYVLIMVNSIFRAHKKVMLPFLTLLLMALLNVLGDLGFGLGWFGLPAFGAAGVAWTTFACAVAGLLCNLLLARAGGFLTRKAFAPWRWNKRAMPYLFRVGAPAAAGQILGKTGDLVTLAMLGALAADSTNVLAGMSVAARIYAFVLFPLEAVNMSMSILSGHMLGARQHDGLYALGLRAGIAEALILALLSALLWLFRAPVVAFFSTDGRVAEEAVLFLLFSCLSGPLFGLAGAFNSIFAGTGATMISCRIYAATCWLVGIPLSWLLGVRFGAAGIYAAGLAARGIAAVWTAHVFRGRTWLGYGLRKRKNTPTPETA